MFELLIKCMKLKAFLLFICSLATLLTHGKEDDKALISLEFVPRWYYEGLGTAVFENGTFVTYHTDDGYKSFVQDVEYFSDYSRNLTFRYSPRNAALKNYSYELITDIANTVGKSSSMNTNYHSLFDIDNESISVKNGLLHIPVKITQENKEKINYNPKHQLLIFALKANPADSSDDEKKYNIVSDFGGIKFSTHEEKPLDISFKGISWWDEEGDYSIDLATHVFQVSEDELDNIKDSVIVNGDGGHQVAIHKVETDVHGITKCCLSVEDSPKKIYGYTYINVKLLASTTGFNLPVKEKSNNDNSIYNILGQKVERVTKGLYIKNGKAFLKQ